MPNAVESIQSKLQVVESIHEINIEKYKQESAEKSHKDHKAFKIFVIAAIIAAVISLFVSFGLNVSGTMDNVTISFIVGMGSIIALMMFYTMFSKNKVISEHDYYNMIVEHRQTVKEIEKELLEATINGTIIRVDYQKSNEQWKNMIIEVDGQAREYYVSFPRNSKGIASAKYYEFVAKKHEQVA